MKTNLPIKIAASIIALALAGILGKIALSPTAAEWHETCPAPPPTATPYVQPTYTPCFTYTPCPSPTCRPTPTPPPTYTPLPPSTPYPTNTPWPPQPPWLEAQEEATVIRVTTLADGGAGSFREALNVGTEGPKVIVFDVGGTIWATQEFVVRYPFVTVAGETAPSPGVTLAGAGLRIRTHDVEVRHLRVRVGDRLVGPNPGSRDGIRVSPGEYPYEAYNVLIDHCSISWATDENVSTWYGPSVHDVAIRNCIISEGLQNSIHPEGAHSCGLLVGQGVKRVEVSGNLFVHNYDRNPYATGGSVAAVVNNVVYNGRLAIYLADPNNIGPQDASVVGNVLLPGPDAAEPRVRVYGTVKQGSRVYLADNAAPLPPRVDVIPSPVVDAPPWWPKGLTALPSGEVLEWVLSNAGARPWERDAVDLRIVADVRAGTGRVVNSQDEVGGWLGR